MKARHQTIKKPSCRFCGRFPSGTDVSFVSNIPNGATGVLQPLLERSFRKAMEDAWPDTVERPALRKLVITIHIP